MSRWDPESDPLFVEDLGNGVTARKRKPRSTAKRRLKAEPEESPDDALERQRQEPAAKEPEPRTPPKRTPPQRKMARIDTGPGLSWLLGLGGTGLIVSGKDPAVGRAISFEAPVAGSKIDQMITGTIFDRLVAQPIARAGKVGVDLGAVLAIPMLVGLIERRPELYPVLEPILKPMVVEMYIEVQEASGRAKARLEAAVKKGGGEKIDADQIMADLFGWAEEPAGEAAAD
jgi:hypothetical protein